MLLVLIFREISLCPEFSSPPCFRIQGGSLERDIHSSSSSSRSSSRTVLPISKIGLLQPKTCLLLQALMKHHGKIQQTLTVDGKVGVKTIAKTFASGKTEKLVYQVFNRPGVAGAVLQTPLSLNN